MTATFLPLSALSESMTLPREPVGRHACSQGQHRPWQLFRTARSASHSMRVLRVIDSLDPHVGGPAVSALNSAISAARAGVRCDVAVVVRPGDTETPWWRATVKRCCDEGIALSGFPVLAPVELIVGSSGVRAGRLSTSRGGRPSSICGTASTTRSSRISSAMYRRACSCPAGSIHPSSPRSPQDTRSAAG